MARLTVQAMQRAGVIAPAETTARVTRAIRENLRERRPLRSWAPVELTFAAAAMLWTAPSYERGEAVSFEAAAEHVGLTLPGSFGFAAYVDSESCRLPCFKFAPLGSFEDAQALADTAAVSLDIYIERGTQMRRSDPCPDWTVKCGDGCGPRWIVRSEEDETIPLVLTLACIETHMVNGLTQDRRSALLWDADAKAVRKRIADHHKTKAPDWLCDDAQDDA